MMFFAALALMVQATSVPPQPPASISAADGVASCPGPFFGFLPNSDRFNPGTEQGMDAIVDHMNSILWRHGWFTVEATVRDTSDPAARDLVRRRQQTILRALVERGVARERIQFSPTQADAGTGLEDTFIIMSNVSGRIWQELVGPGIVC